MQKVTFTSILVFLAVLAFAQPPQGFKYQSVVRDGTGEVIQNQAIALRMNIRQGSAAGTIVYQEIHSVTTNDFGLVSMEIGSETPTIGTFIDIDWGNYDFFLETELDPANGTSFVSMGISQLYSVPYALHAGNSGDSYWKISSGDIYYNSGKVGIGTDSPGSQLHLFSTEATSNGLSVGSSALFPNQQSYLELITQGDGSAKLGQPDNIGWHFTARSASYGLVSQQNDLLLSHWDGGDWKEMMFFETTGNIGIGTSEPTSALEIQGALELGLNTFSIIKTRSDISQIQLQSSQTQYNGAYLLMNSGERPEDPGSIFFTHGNFTAPAPESLIRFRYANDGVISNQMVITSDGNLGVGTSSPGSLLHLYNTQNTAKGISIGSSGTQPNQQSYLELITQGDGTAQLGQPDNVGWHLTARGASYGNVPQQHDLLLSHWDGDDWRDMMFFDTSEKIGVGTTAPAAKLHVYKPTGSVVSILESADADADMYIKSKGNVNATVAFYDDGEFGGSVGYNNENDYMFLYEGGSLVFKDNKLGIGTFSPSFPIDISTSTESRTGYLLNSTNSAQTTIGIYAGANGTGTGDKYAGAFDAIGGSGENIGVRAYAVNGTSNIAVYGTASGGTTNWAGYFNDGNVYIKSKLAVGTTSPSYNFHMVRSSSSDIAEFYNSSTSIYSDVIRAKINSINPGSGHSFFKCVDGNGGYDGSISANGAGGVNYYTTSDGRLKMNIKDISGALELIDKIQPRQYEMKNAPTIAQYGFIAQELKSVYPMAVGGDENSDVEVEPMMIDYSKLTPLLAGATKELHQIVKEQQNVVKEQQNEIDQLKQELESIKKLLEKE